MFREIIQYFTYLKFKSCHRHLSGQFIFTKIQIHFLHIILNQFRVSDLEFNNHNI